MVKIPRIKEGIASSILIDFEGPQANPNWPIEMLTRLKLDNPVLAHFLLKASERFGEEASVVGLIAIRMIESQMEADELTEMFAQ